MQTEWVTYNTKKELRMRITVSQKEHQFLLELIQGCIQKFLDWVDNESSSSNNTHWKATQRVMVEKLTQLTNKIVIQVHLVAESCTICGSRSRQPVQKVLDTPLCVSSWIHSVARCVVTIDYYVCGMSSWCVVWWYIQFIIQRRLQNEDHNIMKQNCRKVMIFVQVLFFLLLLLLLLLWNWCVCVQKLAVMYWNSEAEHVELKATIFWTSNG